MSYKLLELTAFYSKYIDYFYQKYGELSELNYKNHLRTLLSDCFAECDFIHPELQKLGVESEIIVYNDKRLQEKWREDRKAKKPFEILCEQIKSFSPDILYISDIPSFSLIELREIKQILSPTSKIVGWHFTTIDKHFLSVVNYFDEIYTGSKFVQKQLIPYCKSVKLLYHAFEPSILSNLKLEKRENKILFSGSLFLGEKMHSNRMDMFSEFYKNNIDFVPYGNIYGSYIPKTIKQLAKMVLSFNFPPRQRVLIEHRLKEYMRPSVFGIDYYQILQNFSICFNQHAPIAGTGAGNMRMFEATGVGSCLLTDCRDENKDLFIPDEEIVVYRDENELIEKAKWLLDNPIQASEIGLKGQQKTLRDHTYKHKAEMLHGYLLNLLKT